jgi:hypothetical protein
MNARPNPDELCSTGYRATFLAPTVKAGLVVRYRTPLREFLRPGFVDQEGYFNATFTRIIDGVNSAEKMVRVPFSPVLFSCR